MPRSDFRTPRLHVEADLRDGATVSLDRAQAHYLLNVLRLGEGAAVLLFNGRDGEWRTRLLPDGRKSATLALEERTRPQPPLPDLHLLFAPLKQARLDYMAQKAVEMGAGRLCPVITERTQVGRVNVERLRLNAREAAEQCGILAVPPVDRAEPLSKALDEWDGRPLVFCDEGERSQNPLPALRGIERGPLGVLVGPEGGFSDAERERLRALDFVCPIPLGPRVLRADTAAVAALAVVQAALGDWD